MAKAKSKDIIIVSEDYITCPNKGTSPLFEHPRTTIKVDGVAKCPYCNTVYKKRDDEKA